MLGDQQGIASLRGVSKMSIIQELKVTYYLPTPAANRRDSSAQA